MRLASTGDLRVQAPAAHRLLWTSSRLQLAVLLLLAFLHGAQYALLMPPWGLIDEIQHYDYIGQIAERGHFPVTGETLLAPDRVESLFTTRHWERFHWSTPASAQIQDLGAVGYSYEGYQPPAFYLLMAPLYLVTPGDALARLFLLRLAVIGLSLITVFFCFHTARLFSRETNFAFLSTLVLVSIPERTLATSRLNNDVLLEVLGAALAYAVAAGVSTGFTTRRLQGVGLLLAMGVLTKLSMFFWVAPVAAALFFSRHSVPWRQIAWVVAPLVAASALLLGRNLLLYQDLTGYTAFHALYAIVPPPLTVLALLEGAGALYRSFWLIWWKGSAITTNPFVEVLYALLWAGALLSGLKWARMLRDAFVARRWDRPLPISGIFGLAILIYGAAILATYFRGMIPAVQGRFYAPAVVPFVLLLTFGLWRYRYGTYLIAGVASILFAGSMLLLWGGLLPYHYYWSERTLWPDASELGTALQLFAGNLLSDKPAFVVWLQPFAVLAFAGAWLLLWITLVRLHFAQKVGDDAPVTR